jgi:hypothetical protein
MTMLAYYDSFAGLIPCRVISFSEDAFTLQVTAKRGAYDRGAIITTDAQRAIPRTAVYTRSGQYRIRAYTWRKG